MQEPVKIELVCDGNGGVIVFENGLLKGPFRCEYSIPAKLQEYLARTIPKFDTFGFLIS